MTKVNKGLTEESRKILVWTGGIILALGILFLIAGSGNKSQKEKIVESAGILKVDFEWVLPRV